MAKNRFIKRAHEETEFTPEQVLEFEKCMENPLYFIETYVKIVHPTKGAVNFELYEYQRELITMYWKNRDNIILSARQTGKALELETPIPTPTGWTKMGDIQVGDTILGGDGNPTNVTFVTETMYNHQCYEVTFSNGESIIADANHLWEVNDTFIGKKIVKTTEELIKDGNGCRPDGKTCRYSVNTTKPLNLPNQQLPLDPYVFGTWLGDGTSSRGEFTVHVDDLELYNLHQTLYETFDIRPVKNNANVKRICCSELNPVLKTLKVHNNKHIPIQYLRASKEQRIALLQGLMDTDGTVDKARGGCELTLSNDTLANQAYELMCSLGLKPTIKQRLKGGFLTNSIIFTPYRDDFDVFRLSRKLSKQKQSPHITRKLSTKRRSILAITPVDSVPVRCLTVDNNDHMFLAGKGMIPTHNSTTASAYLLWYAIFNFDKTVLIASNKEKGAKEMIARIRYAYEHLPMWLKPGVVDDGWNKHSVGFDNGSRIESTATSEDSGRGMSISLLYLDEFAFVAPNIAEEFWSAIAPTLSTGGDCIITSTPNGDMNLFAQLWRGAEIGVNGFKSKWVKWDEPPGRNEEFKKDQIGKIGQRKWDQEYECIFLSSDALLLDSIWIANESKRFELANNIPPEFSIREVHFWKQIEKDHTYLIGVDPSTGSGEDFSVLTVFAFPEMEQIAEFRSNSMSPPHVYNVLKNVIRYIEHQDGTVFFSVENNGVGEGIISLYEADENPPEFAEFVSEPGAKRRGMTTTAKSKMRACVNLKEMIEKGNLTLNSIMTLKELKMYVRRSGSYAAQIGGTDDSISAMLIIMRILEEISSYDQEAYNKLYAFQEDDWSKGDGGYSDNPDDDDAMPMIFG